MKNIRIIMAGLVLTAVLFVVGYFAYDAVLGETEAATGQITAVP